MRAGLSLLYLHSLFMIKVLTKLPGLLLGSIANALIQTLLGFITDQIQKGIFRALSR